MKNRIKVYEQELSDKMDNNMYHDRLSRTFKRKTPFSYNKIPTAKQYIARERFAKAHQFAQAIIADPVLKILYNNLAGKRCTAYNMAMSEYLLMKEHGQWIL